jgi:hypothetical protein
VWVPRRGHRSIMADLSGRHYCGLYYYDVLFTRAVLEPQRLADSFEPEMLLGGGHLLAVMSPCTFIYLVISGGA